MALNFPSNPSVGDNYSDGGRAWRWNGFAWDLAAAAVSANFSISRPPNGQPLIATAGQTTFTVPGGFDPENILVTLNGSTITGVENVNVSNGSDIIFVQPLEEGDEVNYWVFGTGIGADAPITEADLAETEASPQGSELIGYKFTDGQPFSVPLMQKYVNDGHIDAAYFGLPNSTTSTDQSANFNKMTNWLRSENSASSGRIIRLGPYDYNIEGCINLTNIRQFGDERGFWGIDGQGARIIGRSAGMTMMDLTHSMGFRLMNTAIIGERSSNAPRVGLQLVRAVSGVSSDMHHLYNVRVDGDFNLTGFYNFGSERFAAYSCQFENGKDTQDSWSYICDGINKFGASSDFYSVQIAPNTPVSNLQHSFYDCTFFRAVSSGPTNSVYIVRASKFKMHNCYVTGRSGGSGIVIGSDNSVLYDLEFDVHVEPQGSVGHTLRFEPDTAGASRSLTINGFTFRDNRPNATDAIFRNNLTGTVELRNANIMIGEVGGSQPLPTNGAFYPPGRFKVDGDLRFMANAAISNTAIARMEGRMYHPNPNNISLPSNGHYQLSGIDFSQIRNGTTHSHFEYWPSGTGTVGITSASPGNLGVSFTNNTLHWTRIGDLVFVQIGITFTPNYSTASGEFRITGLPFVGLNGPAMHSALNMVGEGGGIQWPPGTTKLTPRVQQGTTYVNISASGPGTAHSTLNISAFPSGTGHTLTISGVYRVNNP